MKLVGVKDKIDKWFESPECTKYFEELEDTNQIREQRFKRFETWLETNDFDKLMYRLILEHGDEYIGNCYHDGYEPYPNNKLSFLISYITKNTEIIIVKELKNDFPNNIWEFKGYYFQFIYGQGTLILIFNKEDMRTLLQL